MAYRKYGWHFLRHDKKLRYADGRTVKKGVWLRVDGGLRMCYRGMHASYDILDAVGWSVDFQTQICRVELSKERVESDTKVCARARKVVDWIDGYGILRRFALTCAQQAMDLAHVSNKNMRKALRAMEDAVNKRLALPGSITAWIGSYANTKSSAKKYRYVRRCMEAAFQVVDDVHPYAVARAADQLAMLQRYLDDDGHTTDYYWNKLSKRLERIVKDAMKAKNKRYKKKEAKNAKR